MSDCCSCPCSAVLAQQRFNLDRMLFKKTKEDHGEEVEGREEPRSAGGSDPS